MEIGTTRFGSLAIEANDVIRFPAGLLGLDGCQDWVLLADAENPSLGWMQSVTHADVALAVVSPRRFVPDYQVRLMRKELESLALDSPQSAHVLTIVSKNEQTISLNLKAPLLINLERRLGRQVITGGDQPLRFELPCETVPRKKVA
jgi:flagellar assembly factor FliW